MVVGARGGQERKVMCLYARVQRLSRHRGFSRAFWVAAPSGCPMVLCCYCLAPANGGPSNGHQGAVCRLNYADCRPNTLQLPLCRADGNAKQWLTTVLLEPSNAGLQHVRRRVAQVDGGRLMRHVTR